MELRIATSHVARCPVREQDSPTNPIKPPTVLFDRDGPIVLPIGYKIKANCLNDRFSETERWSRVRRVENRRSIAQEFADRAQFLDVIADGFQSGSQGN